jgi:hypothetical protein
MVKIWVQKGLSLSHSLTIFCQGHQTLFNPIKQDKSFCSLSAKHQSKKKNLNPTMQPPATLVASLLGLLSATWPVAGAPPPSARSESEVAPSEAAIFITPGPGMPSQESLGLDPETLYNLTTTFDVEGHLAKLKMKRDPAEVALAHLNKRFNPFCIQANPGGPNNILACGLYLYRLGTTQCSVPGGGDYLTMCLAEGAGEPPAEVMGASLRQPLGVSSYCMHVSEAVFWVYDNCPIFQVNGQWGVEGHAVAWGNGDFLVRSAASRYH